jgi:hypothetical protein
MGKIYPTSLNHMKPLASGGKKLQFLDPIGWLTMLGSTRHYDQQADSTVQNHALMATWWLHGFFWHFVLL